MAKSKQNIFLVDLIHHMRSEHPYFFPLGLGYIGAYAAEKLGERFNFELFRYTDDFSKALENRFPQVIGFSNYLWNLNLSYEYIKIIKRKYPKTVIVMGGPNYDLEKGQVEDFWTRYPEIDFYVAMEGEQAFVELIEVLENYQFDVEAIKKDRNDLSNCHYLYQGEIIQGEMLPRIREFNSLPSPYLSGLMDKFFDGKMVPVIQTARGCPFQCTFCTEGHAYFNKVVKTVSLEDELEYIASKTKGENLCIADANWGMYKEDIVKAQTISRIRKKYNWPKHIWANAGKNNKARVLEVSEILDNCFSAGGAIQSTNPDILKNIKRANIEMPAFSETKGRDSYTELMAGLPGESLRDHIQTLRDTVDSGIRKYRIYQTMLLPNTPMNTAKERKAYGMKTKFRPLTRSFGNYEVCGEKFSAVEYQELCVGNNNMTMDEYFDCRELDLTVETIYDKRYTQILFNLFKELNLSWFDVILGVYENRRKFTSSLAEHYDTYRRVSQTRLWNDPDTLLSYVKGNIDFFLEEENDHHDVILGYSKEMLRSSKDFTTLFFKQIKETLHKAGKMNLERIHQLNAMRYLWNMSTLQPQ